MTSQKLPGLILRLGLAFVFIFAALEMFWSPNTLSVYTPSFVTNIIPLSVFMPLFGGFEFILAAWLLIGKKVFFPAVMATLLLIGIVVFNLSHMSVLFRNIAIAAAALSLAAMNMADIDFLLKKREKESAAPMPPAPVTTAAEPVPQVVTPPVQPTEQPPTPVTPPPTQ